ncbi:MAG: GNAT family N-acetyltransferase [bacterium]
MSFHVEIITSEEQFASMREAWDALVFANADTTTSIFQSWAYLFNHWKFRKTVDGVSRELRLYLLYDDSELIAIAPMWVNVFKYVLRFRVLEFLGSRGLDYLDVITKPGHDTQELVSALFESILDDHCWDVISLSEIRKESSQIINSVVSKQGLSPKLAPCSICVGISLPKTWDEYRAQIGRSTRRHLNYEENRLEKRHKTEFTIYQEYTQKFVEVLNALQLAHQKRWNAVGHTGAFHNDNLKRMNVEICKALADNGALRYFVLTADGIPVAGMACGTIGKTIYVHTMLVALESEFRDLSVGKIILKKAIQWSIENGYSKFDMLRGEEPYKFNFGGEAVLDYKITVCRNTLMKAVVSLARVMGKAI